ncbi:MAG: ATP-binding protein [Bacteroidales bacterium]|jgi:signal transduction histidine kinase|nr:ATP-binding protein [Bacteroidales bacterium]
MQTRLRDIRVIFIVAVVTAAIAVTTDLLYFSDLEWGYRTGRLDKKLIEKEMMATRILETIGADLVRGTEPPTMFLNYTSAEANADGILILVYEDNKITYWSDNSINFPSAFNSGFETHKPVFLSNGWFIPVHKEYMNYDLLALISVYRQYPITNNMLRSGFPDEFRLPQSANITFKEDETDFRVKGIEKEFHFGLMFPEKKPNTILIIIPVSFWFLFLLLLVRLVNLTAEWVGEQTNKAWRLISAVGALVIFYAVTLIAGLPPSVNSTELFSPFLYSSGLLIPSVGHLLLLGILPIAGFGFYLRNEPVILIEQGKGIREHLKPGLLMVLGFSIFLMAENLFRDIILNSAINFEAYKILDLTFMSLAGFIAVLILISIPSALFLRAFILMEKLPLKVNLLVTAAMALVVPVLCLTGIKCSLWGIVYLSVMVFTILLWRRSSLSIISLIAIFAGLTGIYSTGMISDFSGQKQDNELQVMAISVANDNDMVAEALLIDLWPVLRDDTVLEAMMEKESYSPSDIDAVFNYLEDNYFNGYWENYDLNIVICRDDSPLQIPDAGSFASNCFAFFDERIKNEGDTITGTGFWFMHNQAGRAYYFSRLFYYLSPSLSNGLFIELISHIETYQAGYPELLLDASHQRFPRLRDISYAKYTDSTLVLRSGEYPYDSHIIPVALDGDYEFSRVAGFKHLLYNAGDKTLIVTTKAVTPLDKIILFAYLFITILLFSFFLLLIFTHNANDLLRFNTFRRRLQLAFSSVLAIVFVIIIIAALSLSSEQFRNNHTRAIREKTTSVSIELEHKLSMEQSLEEGWSGPGYRSLNELLVKFSNVFMTDINLYSPTGSLLATSRPEVFSRNLVGSMIDPVAFGILADEGKTEYIGEEWIGDLKYLSSYMPFYNNDNQLMAYINLPYFAMQNILTGEISNLIVTMINFTLLLMMLMMWFAVFLSERVTSPLILLQKAMASVEYGKKNEHITYRGRDEIGELVREYNRMIDELGESAGKLARSEREIAWREMARQIAHEIKNPLTPMKLNVQQLFKWWGDRAPDFETKLRKFTDNQIEYIDNLSNIASAFSYFARLPGAEPSEVDVLAQIRTSLDMFGNAENATITLESGNISKAVIMADKEHLKGIFSNLIKNALQAIPSGRQGVITITLSATFDKLHIRITDNGSGIPEELREKMFTPNFTTKSSGMGLGLSIVKRYVETAGGTIGFESVRDRGTSFVIEMPLLYTVERTAKGGI